MSSATSVPPPPSDFPAATPEPAAKSPGSDGSYAAAAAPTASEFPATRSPAKAPQSESPQEAASAPTNLRTAAPAAVTGGSFGSPSSEADAKPAEPRPASSPSGPPIVPAPGG